MYVHLMEREDPEERVRELQQEAQRYREQAADPRTSETYREHLLRWAADREAEAASLLPSEPHGYRSLTFNEE